jgi:hypothetical protein
MRLFGLTLCLLASSLGARAESVEERVTALEARVKALEAVLQSQAEKSVAITAANIEGTYKATLPNGEAITVVFANGKSVVSTGKETKTATYEIIGQQVVLKADGKIESMTIDGDHLRSHNARDKIDFVKIK